MQYNTNDSIHLPVNMYNVNYVCKINTFEKD